MTMVAQKVPQSGGVLNGMYKKHNRHDKKNPKNIDFLLGRCGMIKSNIIKYIPFVFLPQTV